MGNASSTADGLIALTAISTEASGADEVLVAVRDSGPGIDPEHLERIFDSFYTTKLSGIGLASRPAAPSSRTYQLKEPP